MPCWKPPVLAVYSPDGVADASWRLVLKSPQVLCWFKDIKPKQNGPYYAGGITMHITTILFPFRALPQAS